MDATLQFLKDCRTFYLATVDSEGQPHVRPFGAACIFEGKLYIVTNNQKPCFQQMTENPKVEISGMAGGKWIRLTAKAVRDDREAARAAMLEACPSLSRMYKADDGLMEVLYLQDCTASFCSFSDAPEVHKF